jgi:DNA-binding CsgD family transcriptional regulator
VTSSLVEVLEANRYRFSHALVQETLYEDLSAARRLSLHQLVGKMLEHAPGEPASHYAQLSHHFGIAAPLGCAEKAVAYALKAADVALSRYAWETAITQYRLALRALDLLDDPSQQQRCEVLLMLGEAQTLAGDGRERAFLSGTSPEAVATYWQAAHLAQAAGLPEQLAQAALGLAGPNLGTPQGGAEGIDLMERAMAALPSDNSPIRAQLLARATVDTARLWAVGASHLSEEAVARIIRHSDEAVAIARRVRDPRTLAFTLAARREAREGSGNIADWLSDAEEVVQLAEVTGDPQVAIWGLNQKYDVLIEAGQSSAAHRVADELGHLARRMQTPLIESEMATLWAGEALRNGRLRDAERHIRRAEAIWPDTATAAFQMVTIRREQQRMHEVAERIHRRYTRYPNSPQWRSLWILLKYETGAVNDARSGFAEVASQDFSDLPRGVLWLRSMGWLAEAAMLLRDQKRAEQIYVLLLPEAARNLFVRNSDHTGGSVAYYLGLLAMTMERWQDAERHFQDALAMNEQAENWFYAAYTRHGWADMLVRRGREADRQRALELNRCVLQSAEEMEMERLAFHARTLRDQLMSADPAGQPTYNDYGLSSREIDVLRLMVDGQTNREIGEALYISPRTVGSHVSNILGKLGARTRTEAAALTVRANFIVMSNERKA